MPGSDAWCRSERVRLKWRKRYRWLPKRTMRLQVIRGCFVLECWYMCGRGLYPSRSWRTDEPDRPPAVFRMVPDAMKKRTVPQPVAGENGPCHLAPLMNKSMGNFPNLIAHCCVTKYDSGEPRQPGWFTLRTQGSAWEVILKEPDTSCQMRCLGNTLDDALALAELLCGSDDAPWEIDPWAKRNGKKKGS